MKIIVLLFLTAFTTWAQNHMVQIELVNSEVGHVIGSSDWSSCGSQSNDAGLNAIFQSHNVSGYCSAEFTSYPSLTDVFGGLIHCGSCDPAALIADLETYDSVIGRARLTPGTEYYANYLYITLDQATTQTGSTPTSAVITSDDNLNPVFEDLTVFSFEHYFSDTYLLICDCYAPDLAQALIDQDIILPNSTNPDTGEMVFDSYFYQGMVYLSTADFAFDQIHVYPNPFNENLQISTDLVDVGYALYDITGKNIISTFDEAAFTDKANALNPGLYFLQISHSGKSKTVKIIKE